MLNFIRPEIRKTAWRWRESLIGALAVFLGSYWVFGQGGLVGLLGMAVLAVGVLLVFLGLQRGRFRGASNGPGSVDVDEGQITYFGPLTGGAMALRDVQELALLKTGVTSHWRLSAPGTEALHIPVDASGTDELFDAFTALPGLKVEHMLSALRQTTPHDTVIWTRYPSPIDPSRLH